MNNICVVVIHGYVNGYCIVRDLYERGIRDIVLFSYGKDLASFSNMVSRRVVVEKTAKSLKEALLSIHSIYDTIVVYTTDDLQIELLHQIHDEVKDFCFLPFNNDNVIECSDKYCQYEYCKKLGIPYPRTCTVNSTDEITNIENISFPVLVKPNTRVDIKSNVFRSLTIKDARELKTKIPLISEYLDAGFTFLASEIIPGDGSNIYAYVGYRSKTGKILNEWTGKKLSQFPNDFGVFSSGSNEAPVEVLEQGRALLHGMNLMGIAEPEFKYDHRDKKYKLMEINLRSMMWHRVGNLSGVNIQYTQYLDALGKPVPRQAQIKDKVIYYNYGKHEIINLLSRKGYFRIFKNNMFRKTTRGYAVFNPNDIKPFLFDCISTTKGALVACLKRLHLR